MVAPNGATTDKPLNRISEVINNKGIKQTWLAKQLGISFPTINCWVNNKKQPNLNQLDNIASLLQVNIKDLIN